MDIEKILTEGIIFKGSKPAAGKKEEKVKTKAKKKTYNYRPSWFRCSENEAEIRKKRAKQA